jgi:hypothetical protein
VKLDPQERKRLLAAALLAGSWVYIGFTLLAYQSRRDYVTEMDSLYHVAMAQTIREHGITRQFEWTQNSVWRDRYSDKEFLFHVVLVPFCRGDAESAVRGGKTFIALLGLAVFVALTMILRAHGAPAPWLWGLVLLVASGHWLLRMTMIRPHVLSIGLAVVSIHLLLEGRWKAVAAVGFVYSWSYAAPQLLLGMAVVIAVVRRLMQGGAWEWKPMAAAAAGLAGGMVIHPYFPNNFGIWWIQNVQVLFRAWGFWGPAEITLGSELGSVSTRILTHGSTLALGLFVACNLVAAAVRPGFSWKTLALLTLAWVFFLMELLSMRFVEYFVPTVILCSAFAAKELALLDWPATLKRPAVRWVAAAAILAALIGANAWSNRAVFTFAGAFPKWEVGASDWIRSNVPKGDVVLHLSFDEFPHLFLRDRSHRYLVGLDPMFGYASHPEETLLLYELFRKGTPVDPAQVSRRLGGRYLVVQKKRWSHVDAFVQAGAAKAFEDEAAVVLDLTPR